MKLFSRFAWLAPVLLMLPAAAQARDLQGRLGLGYNSEFANMRVSDGAPAVSVKYAFTRDVGAEAILGLSTASPSNSATGVKFFKNLFLETDLNFYFMLGAGVVSGNSHTGAEFLGGFGAEFFIPGVQSLGFSMETGATFDNLSGSYGLRTLGLSFLNAGMHFYF